MTTETKAVAKKAVKKTAPKAKKAEAPAEAAVLKPVSRFAADTLLAPIVTEKSAMLSSKNVIVFRVAQNATRVAVKQAVKELYNVIPVKVNIIAVHPRNMHFGRTQGTTKGYKKAMVTLPAGKTIDVFAS